MTHVCSKKFLVNKTDKSATNLVLTYVYFVYLSLSYNISLALTIITTTTIIFTTIFLAFKTVNYLSYITNYVLN